MEPLRLRTTFTHPRFRSATVARWLIFCGMATLGTYNVLSIIRESAPGMYLNGGELGEILLPRRYIPRDIQPKDKLKVFVYRDSEDRLVATTEQPLATVG